MRQRESVSFEKRVLARAYMNLIRLRADLYELEMMEEREDLNELLQTIKDKTRLVESGT